MPTHAYLWLQTINGGRGDEIDRAAIPAERVAAARTAIEAALARPAGVPLWARPGHMLTATAGRRRLMATISHSGGAPLVTIAVAPTAREGSRLWPVVLQAAEREGAPVRMRRPREPWAVVLAHPSLAGHIEPDDAAWLPMLEAELACAWLAMVDEERGHG